MNCSTPTYTVALPVPLGMAPGPMFVGEDVEYFLSDFDGHRVVSTFGCFDEMITHFLFLLPV